MLIFAGLLVHVTESYLLETHIPARLAGATNDGHCLFFARGSSNVSEQHVAKLHS